MEHILNALAQGWLGTVVGFVGILLAILFYWRSRRQARLGFQRDHVTLVGGGSGSDIPKRSRNTVCGGSCAARDIE